MNENNSENRNVEATIALPYDASAPNIQALLSAGDENKLPGHYGEVIGITIREIMSLGGTVSLNGTQRSQVTPEEWEAIRVNDEIVRTRSMLMTRLENRRRAIEAEKGVLCHYEKFMTGDSREDGKILVYIDADIVPELPGDGYISPKTGGFVSFGALRRVRADQERWQQIENNSNLGALNR